MKHLYPTGEGFLNDWPMTELDVEDDIADELLAYSPPVYSLEPTGWPPAPPEPETDTPHEAGGFVSAEQIVVGEAGPEVLVVNPPTETPDAPAPEE